MTEQFNPLLQNREEAVLHLAAIVESSNDAIVSNAPDGTVLTWNSGAERIYHYSAAEAIGKPMTFLLPPDRHDEESEILKIVKRGQRIEQFETVRLRKDGRPVDVCLNIFPIHDYAGRIVDILDIARDITERKQAEARISHLAAIVESSNDAIVSITPDRIVLTWNSGAERVYGCSAAEATGKPMTFLLPPDRLDEENEILERMRQCARVEHFETVRLRKDGRPIDVSLTLFPVLDSTGRVVAISHIARDITERKQAEVGISHLAAIVQCSDDAIVSLTPDRTVLTWNSGAERLYGYSAAEATGRPLTFFLPPDRRAEAGEIMERILQGQRVEHFETVRLRKDGRPIDVALSISPIRDSAGRIVAISHIGRDITGRKQAEAAHSRLAAIVESSDDAIVGKAPDGIVLTWNSGAERLYGYSAAEATGKPMTFLLPPERRDEESEILECIRQDVCVEHFETVRLRKDGRPIDVSLSIFPVRDSAGRIVAISHIARDITKRKQAEAAVSRLAAIVEFSDDAVISKTPDGIVMTWNSGAERIYGYSEAEAKGRTTAFLLPPDRQDEDNAIRERLQRGQRIEHFETVRQRKDGRLIHVSIGTFLVRDSDGRVVAISHIARDITERKHAEAAFQARLRRIEKNKAESIAVLAAGVAHDFNNLLTGVVGNASLLLEGTRIGDPDRARLIEIIDSSQRAALLTRQLLAYAGKGKMVVEPVDISEVVRSAGKIVQASIPKTVQLCLYQKERLPGIEGDLSQIEETIINLIVNGAEAIGEDTPGKVSVTTSVRQVDDLFLLTLPAPSPIAPGTYVEVEVEDSGCGMDERTMARIFEPFFTTKFTGRGLGLAAVQGIVRGHRGHIRVSSEVGRGTTFKILFPAMNH